MFTGLTTEICEQAWDVISPAIARAAEVGVTNRHTGSLVVLDPVAADGTVLFTAHVGGEVNERTLEFATAKAQLVKRTGRDTSELRAAAPHLYAPGDIKWPGGIIRDGLIVAFSGVQGELDDMIAEWFASAVRGICRVAFNGPQGGDAQPTPYVGRES
ncbi:hypothetical protein [Demequina sp.]|uniref:hypothetical protein n=1 Tax=Demequina sp. TaxID=2050685 RepID=UPI003D0B15C0